MLQAQRTVDRQPSKAQRIREREKWLLARKAENDYAVRLRSVAKMIGQIVGGYAPDFLQNKESLQSTLRRYADLIEPWAKAVGWKMIQDVSQRDKRQWINHSRLIGAALRDEIENAETGTVMRAKLKEQVDLIKSIPLEAAERVHRLTTEALISGTRAKTVALDIQATESVSTSKAMLIARTEVARTASKLTQTRAIAAGCTAYVWRTAKDADVRESHKKMAGTVVRFAAPPTLDGMTGHAGEFPNCFTPDTLVQPIGKTLAVLRARYCGKLIVFDVGESAFKVTPNHPILTPRGWINAGLLEQGDYVMQLSFKSRKPVVDDVDNGHVEIGEIFKSFVANSESTVFSEYDLNGDVFEGDVEIVRAVRNLALDSDSGAFEGFGDKPVSKANSFVPFWRRFSGIFSKVKQSLVASSLYISFLLFIRSCICKHSVSNGSTSNLDAVSFENATNRHASDAASGSDWPNADAACVFLDNELDVIRIVNKRVIEHSGHVYTLQTESGYYNVTPTQVIVKNCRCYIEPIIPTD